MPRPLSPLLHPPLERFHLGRLQGFMGLRRWHDLVSIRRGNPPDHLTFLKGTRHNRALPRLRFSKCRLLTVKSQLSLPFLRVRTVTGVAMLREDRPHFAVEINLGRGGCRSRYPQSRTYKEADQPKRTLGQEEKRNFSSHHRRECKSAPQPKLSRVIHLSEPLIESGSVNWREFQDPMVAQKPW